MNPYEVLGVNPTDDEETIKKAYRNLVKKYHPDRYVNSPLKDEASEKLKEINLAYDIITGKANPQQNTQSQGYSGYGNYGGGYYNTGNFEASFQNVRTLISLGFLDAAEQMLQKLPKTAEWYYLTGIIQRNRGWYQSAKENIYKAAEMDPYNQEYQDAKYRFDTQTSDFRGTYWANFNPCSICASGLCLSYFCCGGRFVPCLCFC